MSPGALGRPGAVLWCPAPGAPASAPHGTAPSHLQTSSLSGASPPLLNLHGKLPSPQIPSTLPSPPPTLHTTQARSKAKRRHFEVPGEYVSAATDAPGQSTCQELGGTDSFTQSLLSLWVSALCCYKAGPGRGFPLRPFQLVLVPERFWPELLLPKPRAQCPCACTHTRGHRCDHGLSQDPQTPFQAASGLLRSLVTTVTCEGMTVSVSVVFKKGSPGGACPQWEGKDSSATRP